MTKKKILPKRENDQPRPPLETPPAPLSEGDAMLMKILFGRGGLPFVNEPTPEDAKPKS